MRHLCELPMAKLWAAGYGEEYYICPDPHCGRMWEVMADWCRECGHLKSHEWFPVEPWVDDGKPVPPISLPKIGVARGGIRYPTA